jgi:hypothetical protein
MTYEELRAKCEDNAGVLLSAVQRDRLASAIQTLDELPEARSLLDLT